MKSMKINKLYSGYEYKKNYNVFSLILMSLPAWDICALYWIDTKECKIRIGRKNFYYLVCNNNNIILNIL
jgi:hypothetical protein